MRLEAQWRIDSPPDSKGYALALLPKNATPPTLDDPAEPNLPGVFALGFDLFNPPPPPGASQREIYFGPLGNIENRPQREVSLHNNGRELANRLAPRPLSEPLSLVLEEVVGGIELTLTVGPDALYERCFIPEIELAGLQPTLLGADNAVLVSRRVGAPLRRSKPVRVAAFTKALNDAQHHKVKNTVAFPDSVAGIGRVVCTLTLENTPKGIDPWDRLAQLFLTDSSGERYEILRWITPYRKAWQWRVDLTDFLPLLRGKKELELACETYSEGWLVSIDFDFYPGAIAREPYKVVKLWNGVAKIGLADDPIERFLVPQTVPLDRETTGAAFYSIVTGHGGSPNALNAGEFHPLWRKLHCDGRTFTNRLWKDDVYLNPCRPQGGTWKFSRAGWSPGDVVAPWIVDLTSAVAPGKSLRLAYELQPYSNPTPEKGFPANHTFASYLILYRKP